MCIRDRYWFERVWKIVTLSLGIILIARGLFALFFFDKLKEALTFVFSHYFKFMSGFSLVFIVLAFYIVSTDYFGPQNHISM